MGAWLDGLSPGQWIALAVVVSFVVNCVFWLVLGEIRYIRHRHRT